MKKAIRLYLTGTVQSLFFRTFIKENADANDIGGFIRMTEDGRAEIFLEGNGDDVEAMRTICKQGPKYATIRHVEEKPEHIQGFKEFKILRF